MKRSFAIVAIVGMLISASSAGQGIKERMQQATRKPVPSSSTPSAWSPPSQADGSSCPFLTRSSVRADGGGLNRHAAGSVLCHEEVMKQCVDSRWQGRGPCSAFQDPVHAWQVEGTNPSGQSAEENLEQQDGGPYGRQSQEGGSRNTTAPGEASGRNANGSQQGEGGVSGNGLMGRHPEQDILEREEQAYSQRYAAQQRRQQQGSNVVGNGNSPDNQGRDMTSICNRLQNDLRNADQQIAEIVRMSNSISTDPNNIAPSVRPYWLQAKEIRAQIVAKMQQNQCQ